MAIVYLLTNLVGDGWMGGVKNPPFAIIFASLNLISREANDRGNDPKYEGQGG